MCRGRPPLTSALSLSLLSHSLSPSVALIISHVISHITLNERPLKQHPMTSDTLIKPIGIYSNTATRRPEILDKLALFHCSQQIPRSHDGKCGIYASFMLRFIYVLWLQAVSGPSVWNSLPTALRMSDCSLTTFRTQLKALLFI